MLFDLDSKNYELPHLPDNVIPVTPIKPVSDWT